MNWLEVCVPAGGQDIELMCEKLQELGVSAMVVEDQADFESFFENNTQYWDYVDQELSAKYEGISRIKFYLSDDREGAEILERVSRCYETDVSKVADSDWENNWRQYYEPIEVGKRLVIVPQWQEYEGTQRVILRLDPGLIFGTGSHATTRMCLCEIEKLVQEGGRVLDIGSGSGILGIAALLLGCGSVKGCDVDPKAPEVSAANAALNGIGGDRFSIYAGDILGDDGLGERLGTGYDMVLANIVADVIIPLAQIVPDFVRPGGYFVCSGIIEGRQDEVRRAVISAGFEVLSASCEEEWHCFACRLAVTP